MRRARKIFLWVIVIVILAPVLLLGGGALFYLYGPEETIKGQLIAALEDATGRRIEIDGPLERALTPGVVMTTGAVRVYDADQPADAQPLIAADSISATAAYLPLFGGRLELSEVGLILPRADFAAEETTPTGASVEPIDLRVIADAARGERLHIRSLKVVGGAARFRDANTGRLILLEEVALSYSSPKGGGSAVMEATGLLGGKQARLDFEVQDLDAVALGDAGVIKIDFKGAGVSFAFDGRAAPGNQADRPVFAKGALSFSLTDDRQATGWLRAFFPAQFEPLQTVDAQGEVDFGVETLSVDLSGAARFNGADSTAMLKVAAGEGWRTGATVPDVELALVNPFVDAGFVGRVGYTPSGGLLLEGDYRLKAPDVRALGRWATASETAPFFEDAPLLESVDITGSAALLDDKAEGALAGGVRYNGVDTRLDGALAGGSDWRAGGATSTRLTAQADGFFSIRWRGVLELFENRSASAPAFAAIEGDLTVSTPNVARLRSWLQLPPTAAQVGDVAFDGRVRAEAPEPPIAAEELQLDRVVEGVAEEVVRAAEEDVPAEPSAIETATAVELRFDPVWNGAVLELEDAQIRVDGKATGMAGRLEIQDGLLRVDGALTGGPLDLTPITEAAVELTTGFEDESGASFEEIALDAPNVGLVGWSGAPYDFSGLAYVEGVVQLDLKGLRAGPFEMGILKGTLAVAQRKLTVEAEQAQIFSGTGGLRLSVDASGATPRFGLDADLKGGQWRDIFAAFGQPSAVLGKLDMRALVTAEGASQADIAASINGDAAIFAESGVLFLIDFRSISGAGGAEFLGARQIARGVTPYDVLSASFVIVDGVARNRDLELEGSVISFEGKGSIDIGKREIDYTVVPTRFGEISIIDGIIGAAFPIKIIGSWDAIQIGTE